MSLCTTPNTTWTHVYRRVGLWVRVHVLCTCTSPQEHLSCIVYSVFRRLQASVYVLVHYAIHHMDTCVYVCCALCACACTLYGYFTSGTPFLYRVFRVQASIAVQPVHSTHMHFSSPLTQHCTTLCLYRPPNTSIPMHTFASLKHGSRTYSSTTSRLVVHAHLST